MEFIIKGQFKLRCGLESDYLVDTSKFLRTSKGRRWLEALESPDIEYDAIGGPLSAADLICPIFANKWFGVRATPKGRGLDIGCITGNLEKGQRVLLVEDVCTTGATLSHAVEKVAEFGAIPVALFTLIDRPDFGGIKQLGIKYNLPTYSAYMFNELSGELELDKQTQIR